MKMNRRQILILGITTVIAISLAVSSSDVRLSFSMAGVEKTETNTLIFLSSAFAILTIGCVAAYVFRTKRAIEG